MKTFSQFISEEGYPSWVHKPGTPVSWVYRTARGYGHIVSVEELGKDNASTRYKVRPADRRFHKGEPEFRIHTGADISVTTEDAIEAHLKKLAAENK